MCYSHSQPPEDWFHAAETCRQKGGSLAEVTSTYVKTQLTDYLEDLYPDGKKFYFGLNSLGYRGSFFSLVSKTLLENCLFGRRSNNFVVKIVNVLGCASKCSVI